MTNILIERKKQIEKIIAIKERKIDSLSKLHNPTTKDYLNIAMIAVSGLLYSPEYFILALITGKRRS